jgi:hypothetical protein
MSLPADPINANRALLIPHAISPQAATERALRPLAIARRTFGRGEWEQRCSTLVASQRFGTTTMAQIITATPRRPKRILVTFAIAGIAGNACATEGGLMSAPTLLREWKALEAACRGSNEPTACERLDGVEQQLGQKGWCFNGYGSGRRWVRC